jgi:hypothetical protein
LVGFDSDRGCGIEDGKKQEENRCLVSCLLIKELLVVELLNASRVPYVWWHSCASPSTLRRVPTAEGCAFSSIF